MSSLLVDLNNDGLADILYWRFDRHSEENEGQILLSDGTTSIQNWSRIDLPAGPFGFALNKYNHAVTGDLDNDGYMDVVVSVTRGSPYYAAAYLQILINDGTGTLVDRTEQLLPLQPKAEQDHGEVNLYLRDLDSDGDLDIFHSTGNDSFDGYATLYPPQIILNRLPDRLEIMEDLHKPPAMPLSGSGWGGNNPIPIKLVPINLDEEGCLDLISATTAWSWYDRTEYYLYTQINTVCEF